MGSIPLLTSLSDPRNMLTLWAFLSAILMLHKSVLDFEVNIVFRAHEFIFSGAMVNVNDDDDDSVPVCVCM